MSGAKVATFFFFTREAVQCNQSLTACSGSKGRPQRRSRDSGEGEADFHHLQILDSRAGGALSLPVPEFVCILVTLCALLLYSNLHLFLFF
jgi:hypothetical protein